MAGDDDDGQVGVVAHALAQKGQAGFTRRFAALEVEVEQQDVESLFGQPGARLIRRLSRDDVETVACQQHLGRLGHVRIVVEKQGALRQLVVGARIGIWTVHFWTFRVAEHARFKPRTCKKTNDFRYLCLLRGAC